MVESVKAASDVYAPINGEIVEINEELVDNSEWANEEPYGKAWFFKIKPANPSDMVKSSLINCLKFLTIYQKERHYV